MTGPLYRLGGFVARHALWVFLVWILFTVGLLLGANGTGSPTADDTDIPGSDATTATDLLAEKLPLQENGTVPIVLKVHSGTLTSGANKTAVQKTVDQFKANQYVKKVVSPLSKDGKNQLAEHDTVGIISLFLTEGSGDLTDDEADDIFAAADPARDAGLEVSAGGYLGSQLSSPSTRL